MRMSRNIMETLKGKEFNPGAMVKVKAYGPGVITKGTESKLGPGVITINQVLIY